MTYFGSACSVDGVQRPDHRRSHVDLLVVEPPSEVFKVRVAQEHAGIPDA